jgi:hypothetical protein
MRASDSFDWGALVDLAGRLLAQGDRLSESRPLDAGALYRTAIGRAYYGVRGLVLGKLPPPVREGLDQVGPGGHVGHTQLWMHLRGQMDGRAHRIGKRVRDLLDARVAADYRDHVAELHVVARACVARARALREELDAITRLGD